MPELTYAEAVASLEGAVRFGIHPSLDGIRVLNDALGRPDEALRCIQVTGTNGKTSVTRMLAATIHAHGRDAAAYTSPHLVAYTERIEIAGEPATCAAFARAVGAALEAAAGAGGEHTEFELLTAAALWLLRDAGVEWAVLEVGMGGRWDATTVVDPEVAVVTGVGLDHTERLGDSVEEIADDKAHIIRAGRPAILGPGTGVVDDVFARRAAEVAASLVRVREVGVEDVGADVRYRVTSRPDRPGGLTELTVEGTAASYGDLAVAAPSFQAPNVAVAIAAAEAALGGALHAPAVREALAGMVFPGRFEVLREAPPFVLDGAHNPQAAGVLSAAISEAWGEQPRPVCVLGALADKDVEGMVAVLAPAVRGFVVTEPDSPRALSAETLAECVRSVTGELPAIERDPMRAVARAEELGGEAGVVVAGSLYLVGQVRGRL